MVASDAAVAISRDQWLLTAVAAATAAVLVLAAELFHIRRISSVGQLLFGPSGRPAAWVRVVPLLRSVAAGLLSGGLMFLWFLPPSAHTKSSEAVAFEKLKHIVIALDVSPSMRLQDAGPDRDISRMARARSVMESYFERVPMNEFRISVVAFYTGALPVVKDTRDPAVIRNILNDLPMHFAFAPGETDLFAGLEEAAKCARGFRPDSTALIIISDGDTVPGQGMPRLPNSVSETLVVGVGDVRDGTFINGRHSRQDVSALRQIAARLKGTYHNGNEQHLSTSLVDRLTSSLESENVREMSVREAALILITLSTLLLAVIPIALHYTGTRWMPGVRTLPHADHADG